jgi:hypothetical protein
MGASLRKTVVWWAPSGLVARRRARSRGRVRDAARQDRSDRYAAIIKEEPRGDVREYEDLVRVAIDCGVDETTLRHSSIPVNSLDFVVELIDRGPGLHIGNYAGVSLAYLAGRVDGLIVAVDPNVPHRGLKHGQDSVVRLVTAAGVQDRVVLICGYSRSKNPSNQGAVVRGYDPASAWAHEFAPECVLANLGQLGVRFGWALLDGNHEPNYLRAELADLEPLLLGDGLVFLDDCSESWPEIRDVFRSVPDGWCAEATDGRIGVLRRVEGNVD